MISYKYNTIMIGEIMISYKYITIMIGEIMILYKYITIMIREIMISYKYLSITTDRGRRLCCKSGNIPKTEGGQIHLNILTVW